MKKQFPAAVLAVFALGAMTFTSCSKRDCPRPHPMNRITLTTTAPGEFKIHIAGSGKAVIDWGDGSAKKEIALTALPSDYDIYDKDDFRARHTYSGTGTKTVTVTGTGITGFENQGDGTVTSLDAREMPGLIYLSCSKEGAAFTSLKLGVHPALTHLYCYGNALAGTLDVSKYHALENLQTHNNALTSLKLGTHNTLDYVTCDGNKLDRHAIVEIFGKLPARIADDDAEIYCGGENAKNPGYALLTDADKKVAADKNWTIEDY